MRPALLTIRGLGLLVLLAMASCKDDAQPPEQPGDKLTPCLDQPTALARPPSGQLPCELLPPGFSR